MTVLSAVAAALALSTAPAAGQFAGATVAGPTPSGATLVAFDRGAELCLRVDVPGDGGGGPECGPPPASAYDVQPAGAGDEHRSLFFAAVPPGVATIVFGPTRSTSSRSTRRARSGRGGSICSARAARRS